MGFVCGGILFFEGWRLDPILLLCQVLASLMVMGAMGENIIGRLQGRFSMGSQRPLSGTHVGSRWRLVWYGMKLGPRWRRFYYDPSSN